MMSSILKIRDDWVKHFKKALPKLKTCTIHPGPFDLNELAKISLNTPAVLVACLGSDRTQGNASGELDLKVKLVAFVITTDANALSRDQSALNIVEALLVKLHDQDWAESTQRAEIGAADNLYSGKLKNKDVCMWSISWQQGLRLGNSIYDEDGTLPTVAYVSSAPQIGEKNKSYYTQVRLSNLSNGEQA